MNTTKKKNSIDTSTMNFFTDYDAILALPISERERNHPSRTRIGYHVFLSQFFTKINSIPFQEKVDILVGLQVWTNHYVNADSDDDSVLTVANPQASNVMRGAARVWQAANNNLKEAWSVRAERLNDRPPSDGTFQEIPEALQDPSISLEETVLTSLSSDWRYIVSLFKVSVIKNIKRFQLQSETSYKFGNERVTLYTQSYRSFYLTHLLKLSIFGSPLLSNLSQHEIVYRKRRTSVVFIYSYERMTDLFSFGGLNATTFFMDGLKYVCCAKANLTRGQLNAIGYVMEEEGNTLKIKVEGEQDLIEVRRPQYDSENGSFNYENANGDQGVAYSLTQLWPIRIKLNVSGQVNVIISAHSYVDDEPEHL